VSGIRVLVAGASIAGPALAHWLHRRGAEVTVVERAPGLRPGGQAVDARGVAKEVIVRMGLDAAVRAARTDTAGAYTVDVDGNVLETYRADDHGGDGYIAEIEILRGDLSQVLYDDTRDGVEYVFGDRIAELTQDADGVDVTFAGGDRRRFDLVIGADGLHSSHARATRRAAGVGPICSANSVKRRCSSAVKMPFSMQSSRRAISNTSKSVISSTIGFTVRSWS
jgi:2-polyprenyl-6-methoxyphenol hydroxylase-like FAD-dependent oxidoreductase